MSNEELIGVDPLDWMNKSEVEDLKNEIVSEQASDKNNQHAYKLDKNFDIRNLEAMYKEINSAFNTIKSISIDLSEVVKLDAASVQFLLSLKKTADDKLINIEFLNPNDYFKKSIMLMGLSEAFN